jgi:hypothetical protein
MTQQDKILRRTRLVLENQLVILSALVSLIDKCDHPARPLTKERLYNAIEKTQEEVR